MKIVWDEPKRLANIDKHHLDFVDLTLEFFQQASIGPAKLGRLKALGPWNGTTISVIFVFLGSEAISVISMRPARHDEGILIK